MAYILTIDFPDAGESEESYDYLGYARARIKELQSMPWAHSGVPAMSLVDSAGAEIDIDTGMYIVNVNRRAPDPIGEAMAEDTAQRFPQHIGRSNRLPPIPDAQFCISSNKPNPEFDEFNARMIIQDVIANRAVLTPEQCRAADSSETILVNANWLGELLNERESPDANVEAVREAMLQRSEFGLRKYGITTADSPLGMAGWLQHLQEELMDATVYVQCLKGEVEAEQQRLRILIADAYEEGWSANEVRHNPAYEGVPNGLDVIDKESYVNRVLAEQVKEK